MPRTFGLVLDRPVRFDLWASTLAQPEKRGDLASLDEDIFAALPSIQTVLRPGAQREEAGGEVPVRLRAALTEIGTLELCASRPTATDGSSSSSSGKGKATRP